jgi:ubiquinone/menaquinone biosynthesis C-methylase UbiE
MSSSVPVEAPPFSDWNELAELDPLWTILSDPQKKFGKWDPAEFFATGEREADRVMAMCKSHGLALRFGTFLDFGCGVGRMTRGFSRFFASCVGLDVSKKMVGLAEQFNASVPNCQFVASEAVRLPFESNRFDFVFSTLVLQHLPTRRMILSYIAEFIRVAKEGGAIVFQLPMNVPLRRRLQLRRRAWATLASVGVPSSWMFKKAGLAPILINGISRKEVERFIRAQGAQLRAAQVFESNPEAFHSYYYFAIKEDSAASGDAVK